MARRAVRKRRHHAVQGAGERTAPAAAPPSAAVWRTPAFWLGGLVVGVVAAAIVATGFLVLGRDDEIEAVPAAATPAADGDIKSAEELEAEFNARDRDQIEELTSEARTVAATLQPVMSGLEDALPREGGPAEQVAEEQIQEWVDITRDAAAPYAESISGGTGFNVARNTIRSALDSLIGALETYRLSGAAGADRAALHRQAAAQRDNAVRTWSAAGVQLDAINIDAGFGHQHIEQLAGPAAGGQAPDSLPEGTDAHAPE